MSKPKKLFIIFLCISIPILIASLVVYVLFEKTITSDVMYLLLFYYLSGIGLMFLLASIVLLVISKIIESARDRSYSSHSTYHSTSSGSSSSYSSSSYSSSSKSTSSSSSSLYSSDDYDDNILSIFSSTNSKDDEKEEFINLNGSDGTSNGLRIGDGKITGVDGYGLHYYVDKDSGRISGLNGDTKGYIKEDGTVTDIDGWTKGRITSDGRFVDNCGNTQNDVDDFIENLNKY